MGLKGLGLGLRDLGPRWCLARDDASRAGFARRKAGQQLAWTPNISISIFNPNLNPKP